MLPNNVKLSEAKTDRNARRERQIHYYSWRFQHLSLRNGQIQLVENQQDQLTSIAPSATCTDIIDIHRLTHPGTVEYTFFFSTSHETFTVVDHILGHKTYHNIFKRL